MTFSTSTASATLTSSVVAALEGYRTASGIKLSIYRARPRHIQPPHAWIDSRHDEISPSWAGASAYNALSHTATVNVVVVHGYFDGGEAIDQRDAFVDGFNNYLRANRILGLAGANSNLESWSVDDGAAYTPDWVPEDEQTTYYATTFALVVSLSD